MNEEGYPSLEDCLDIEFGEYYFTDSVASLFQALYRLVVVVVVVVGVVFIFCF